MEDTEIRGVGHQAVYSHAGAGGFTLNNCLIQNSTLNLVNEGSVTLESGSASMTNTKILGSKAGGQFDHSTSPVDCNSMYYNRPVTIALHTFQERTSRMKLTVRCAGAPFLVADLELL